MYYLIRGFYILLHAPYFVDDLSTNVGVLV